MKINILNWLHWRSTLLFVVVRKGLAWTGTVEPNYPDEIKLDLFRTPNRKLWHMSPDNNHTLTEYRLEDAVSYCCASHAYSYKYENVVFLINFCYFLLHCWMNVTEVRFHYMFTSIAQGLKRNPLGTVMKMLLTWRAVTWVYNTSQYMRVRPRHVLLRCGDNNPIITNHNTPCSDAHLYCVMLLHKLPQAYGRRKYQVNNKQRLSNETTASKPSHHTAFLTFSGATGAWPITQFIRQHT